MKLPQVIAANLPETDGVQDELGCSGATVLQYPDRVLKIQGDCNVSANEGRMLRWMQGRIPVPRVIASAHEEHTRWLLMSRVPGSYLCTPEILDDQHRLAELCASALQTLWKADITDCPTDRTVPQKLREIEAGLRAGTITRDTAMDPNFYEGDFASPAALFDWLVKHQPEEVPVLSHGDLCLPNIFADEKGLTGFIDVGLAGVADRWVDIEKCLWSMWANTTGVFGGPQRAFDRQLLFDALGMQPDEDKLRYYGLLDQMA